jgi:hypothetical protein
MGIDDDVRAVAACRYYLDDFGALWAGPLPGGGGFRYLHFQGVCRDDLSPCWVWRRHDPGPGWEEIPLARALRVVGRYREEGGYA